MAEVEPINKPLMRNKNEAAHPENVLTNIAKKTPNDQSADPKEP